MLSAHRMAPSPNPARISQTDPALARYRSIASFDARDIVDAERSRLETSARWTRAAGRGGVSRTLAGKQAPRPLVARSAKANLERLFADCDVSDGAVV